MMLQDLILANRSYRSFDMSAPVPHSVLTAMVEAARFSPSSINLQPLCFYLVEGAEACAKLLPLTGWARNLPNLTLPPEGHAPTAYIVICQDLTIAENPTRFNRDVGIVAQSMMLAAVEAGYGGCMIGNFRPDAVAQALSLDTARHLPQLILALGKPDEKIYLTDLKPGQPSAYYRDEENRHFVPKRRLEDSIIS